MNRRNMNEGSIDVKEKTNKIMVVIKRVLRGMYDNKEIIGGEIIEKDSFNRVLDVLDIGIGVGLESEGIEVGCPIYFVNWENEDANGWYNPVNNEIYINGMEYITKEDRDDRDGVRVYMRYFEIRFDKLSRTLEHELVHYEQGLRSGGKLFKINRIKMTDEEYKELEKRLKVKKMDKEQLAEFIKLVRYFNKEVELDTFANNAADKYVQYMVEWFVKSIRIKIRDGEEIKREYSGDEVKRVVLQPIYNAREGGDRGYFNLRFLKDKLKESHKGYKYLTVGNRKKWWKYVIKALLNHKFEGIVI